MSNLIEFGRGFLSYGLLFLIAAALVVTAVLLGIRLRKNKDAKDALNAMNADNGADGAQGEQHEKV